jgi:transcriptional regulator with XRE-family HTH domain
MRFPAGTGSGATGEVLVRVGVGLHRFATDCKCAMTIRADDIELPVYCRCDSCPHRCRHSYDESSRSDCIDPIRPIEAHSVADGEEGHAMDRARAPRPACIDAATGSFAVLLRRHRNSRHMTQEELAFAAGLSVRAVRNAELGRVRCPRRDSVQRLAEALELAAEDHRRLADAARAQRVLPVAQPAGPAKYVYLTPDSSVTVLVRRDPAVSISRQQMDEVSTDNDDGEPAILLTFSYAGQEDMSKAAMGQGSGRRLLWPPVEPA